MATQYKTPADLRLERAQALQMKRLEPQIRREQNAQEQDILKAYKQAEIDAQIERSKQNFLVRSASTVGDVVGNVITGALKGIEGIVDFGLAVDGALNPLAYLFDYQDATKEFATKDLVGTYIDAPMEDFFKYSYTKDGSVGRTVEDVASGVGQLLPAVAAAYFTGGSSLVASGASFAGMTVPQAVSLAVTTTSAAGNATEQAYQDGAGRYEGLLYGTASGAMEAATEKLTGGIGIYGKGLLNKVARSTVREGVEAVAKTGAKRVISNAIGEAGEEIIAELANPALKSIYKGKDAFSEYGDPEYWKGVGHAGIVGGLTSVAHGGTTGYLMKQSGAYADVQSVLEELDALEERADKMDMDTFAQAEEKYNRSRKQNYQVLERVLQNASAKQRADIIKRYRLSDMFAEDGSMQADFAKQLDTGTEAKYNKRYYNRVMRNSEDLIESDLERLNDDLAAKYGEETKTMSVFDGELSEKGRTAASKVKQLIKIASEKSGKAIGFVITDGNVPQFRGVNVGDRIYMSADTFEKGDAYEVAVEETMHFAEGSEEHNALVKLLAEDGDLEARAVDEVLGADGYGFDGEAIRDIGRRIEAGAVIEGESITAEELRYSQKYFKFLHKNFPGERESQGSDAHKWATLWAARQDVKVGDQALAYFNGHWYLIERFNDADSGYQVEAFVYAADYWKIAKEIKEYGRSGKIREVQGLAGSTDRIDLINKRSYSLGREGAGIDRDETQYVGENRQVQRMGEGTDEGRERSGRDGGGDRESGGTNRQGDPVTVTREEWLAYEEYRSEVGAHMGAELLGNEAFIDKIVHENGSLGEKILGKIIAFKEALGRIGDPEAQAQHKRLVEAEKLYLDAIEAAGKKYVNGKIVSAIDDEEKENTAEGGGKYSFAGPKAKTADKMKLATAQEMLEQGVDSETVRKETGWFRGYDGKWRFEISDFEASLIENPNLEKHTDDGEVYFTGKLSDILDHKELFEAYPELKDINIVIQKTDFGVYGIYQPNSNYITLSIEHFKRATKEYYDYANGGRKAEIERIEATPEYQAYNSFYEMDDAENMDPEEWLRQEKELRDRFFNSDLGKRYYQLMWGKNGFTGEKYEFGWGTGGKETLLHELQHAIQRIEGFASGTSTRDANYGRNAGEIEARDVATRSNLTAEQRKNHRPDIDQKDVVFAGDGEASYEIKHDKNGNEYWQIDSGKDIFQGLSTPEEYRDAAFAYLISNRDNKITVEDEFGRKIVFIRLSAEEFTRSDESNDLFDNNPEMFKQKMRLVPSLEDILLHANVNWHSPDHKKHKLFKKNGFENYRGKVRIDNVIFNSIVRVGQANFGNVFYDINLEVDSYLPHTNNSASDINESTSYFNSISQKTDSSTPKAKFSLKDDGAGIDAQTEVNEDAGVEGEVSEPLAKEYKQYSQKEVKALVNAILSENLSFEQGQATFEKKADVEQEVKKLLDTAALAKTPEEGIGKIADYILGAAHIKGVYADASAEVIRAQKTVDSLSRYIHSLDLSPVMGKLTKEDGKTSGAFYRWNNRKGHEVISLEQLRAELAEQGFHVEGKTPEQIFFTMDSAYGKADRLLKKHEREHGGLRAILSEDAYTKAREGIVAKLTEVYRTGGRTSEGMRVIAEREKKLADREARATEKTKDAMRQVKNAANETLYSQEEARAVIDKILAETLDMGEWRGVLRHGTYTASVQKAFAMLNSAEQGKQWSAAYELAGFLMKRVSLVDQIDAAEAKPYIERLEILKPYIRGIDLSGIKKEFYELTGSDSAFRRWHKPKDKGGISVEEFFEAIRKKGFDPDSDTARAMMLIDEEYAGVKDILSEKVELSLEEVLLGDEAEKLKREIAKVVFQSFDESKSFSYANLQKVARSFAAKLEKVTEESRRLRREKAFYEREYEKYYKGFMKERQLKEDTRGLEAATRKTVELVKDIRNWKAGNFQSAAKHRNSNFEETIGSFARLAINGQLNLSGGRKIFADALTWYAEENELFTGYFDPDVATKMKAIADGRGMYTAIEVKQMADVLQNFKKIVEEYGKIFRNGKRIEARPEADRYQGYIKADEHLNTSFTLYGNKFFREIAEPLSLAESADKYRRDGFFTESMQELRQGLIKKETLELDFRRPIDEFLKKQGARYQKSLSKQLVKVGGIMIPKNNALLLYMTTKDADAHGALNVGGFSIVDGAKKPLHDDKTKQALASDGLVYGRMEAGEDVTMEEATAAVLSLRSELYDQFSDTDKELIRICEQFFNVDGKKVKHDTDIDVKGYSNVKEGYYVPLSHDGRAEEIGLEVQREGVLNYRFNKSRVKGAKGRLMIRPLTDVLFDQMEDIATYAGVSIPIENFNRLYNLNTSDSHYKPTTIKSMLAQDQRLWSDGLQYFQKLINGIEGGGESLGFISKAFGFLRSGLVRTWLSLNPKVLCTQVSALSASFSRLNPKYVAKSVGMRVGKAEAAEMDKYCRLADLRNQDNSAALAQGVIDDINRFGDIGMKGIGFMDRQMIMRLWNACRLQVQAEQKLAFDSEENKIAAGKLLETVILDTQQNSLITERSAMMRSSNEIFKSFTMFSADAMKVSARFLGAFGRVSTIYRRIKLAKDQGATASQIEALNKEMSMSKKELTGATAAMLTSAIYMAAISLLFKAIYGKLDDEDEPEDHVLDFGADVVASILGGLPIIREIWDFMANGYEIDNHVLSAVNDILSGVKGVYSLADDIMSGKDVDKSEFGGKIRNLLYAVGQIFGVPLRNVHNVLYGVTRFIDAPTAYQWDDATSPQSYRSDLNKAIEKGDEKMVAMIADLMVEESFGTVDARSREVLKSLIGKGYDVLPRSVGDSVTYDGEEYEFTARSRKRFEEVYGVADVAVKDLVSMSKFSSADAAVQAKAIRFIYDVYYNLALEDFLGVDLENKTVLFAEALDIEKLALIIATARAIEGDKDRNGKTISGSKKLKIVKYIESLRMSAAEKYMLMGYLGYKNKNGEAVVRSYINKLSLTKKEKEQLLSYSGYAA